MIVINKKRIQIVLSCLLIGIFTFSFKIASNKNESAKDSNLEQKSTLETTATPVSGKTIVIDAGHGAPDERSTEFKWYDRSRNQFKNCIKSTKLIRTKRLHSNINSFR